MTLPKLDLNFFAPTPKGVDAKKKEQPIGQFIPYTVHYDDSTLLTEHNQLIKIIKLEGLSFQTRDEDELRRHKVFRNRLARSISKSDYGVYLHIVRRKHFRYPDGVFPNQFCTDFDAAWMSPGARILVVAPRPGQRHGGVAGRALDADAFPRRSRGADARRNLAQL